MPELDVKEEYLEVGLKSKIYVSFCSDLALCSEGLADQIFPRISNILGN